MSANDEESKETICISPSAVIISSPCHKCYLCDKDFSSISAQRRHIRRIHKEDTTNLSSKSHIKCPLCSKFQCCLYTELYKHLQSSHDLNLEMLKLKFLTFKEFEEWKQNEEKLTNSLFVKDSGDRHVVTGIKKISYRCSRSGIFKSKGVGKRALKRQGSRKLNAVCPSRMVVNVDSIQQTVTVEYVKTHCGHNNELGHLNLSKIEREEIAQQLMTGQTESMILDTIRKKPRSLVQRKDLITRKDLHNIKKSFKISEKMKTRVNSAPIESDLKTVERNLIRNEEINIDLSEHCNKENENSSNDDLIEKVNVQYEELLTLCQFPERTQILSDVLEDTKFTLLEIPAPLSDDMNCDKNVIYFIIPVS